MAEYKSEYNLDVFSPADEQPDDEIIFSYEQLNQKYEKSIEDAEKTQKCLEILDEVSVVFEKVLKRTAADACEMGMYLEFLRRNVDFKMLAYDGYEDYAYKVYGLNRKTAYNYRQIFLHFSETDKNGKKTGKILKQYKNYTITLLALIADLDEEERRHFDEKTTCSEILRYKKAKREELKMKSVRDAPEESHLVEKRMISISKRDIDIQVGKSDLCCVVDCIKTLIDGKGESDIPVDYSLVLADLFERFGKLFFDLHDDYMMDICRLYSKKMSKRYVKHKKKEDEKL